MMSLDRSLSLIILILAVAYGWGAFNFPPAFAGPESVGPATFPKMLAVVMVITSLALVIKPEHTGEPVSWYTALEIGLVVLILLAYVFLIEPFGFVIATSLMVSVLCWRMRVTPLKAILTGLVSSVLVFTLFHFGLALPLPLGPLEGLWTH